MTYEKLKSLAPEAFKRYCGVQPVTFAVMLEVLSTGQERKKKSGRPSKLGLEDQLLMTLTYWREYRTLFHVAMSYSIHESTAQRIVTRIEDELLASGKFSLPKKQDLLEAGHDLVVVIVDSTETPIERPKKKQKRYYSGVLDKAAPPGPVRKKKRHTLKTQVMIDFESFRVLDVAQASGPVSDLTLFKESRTQLLPDVWYLADKGYQGLAEVHQQTVLPIKKPRHRELSVAEKHANGRLARLRIRVEHVIHWLKVFRILAERYRNRRKRLGLRFSLIAGLHNFELATA